MDVISTIREKTGLFSGTDYYDGLEAVILHLEIAEKHQVRGKDFGEDYLFTDVVYRTNHAFEGALKEAYSLFAGKVSQQTTPHQIEKYFEANSR